MPFAAEKQDMANQIAKSNIRRRQPGRSAQPAHLKFGGQSTDYSMVFIVLFLVTFGLVMLYSTSSYEAGIEFGDAAHYLKKQLFATALGLGGMLFMSRVPYLVWEKLAWGIYIASVILVLMIIPFGTSANGAKRWIYFGPVSVQPAEFSKLAVIIVTAMLITRCGPQGLRYLKNCGLVLLPAVIQAIMIYFITRNLSSAIIILAIAGGMLFVAARDYWRFFALFGLIAVAAVGAVALALETSVSDSNFRFKRILVWMDPAKYADDTGFQTLQALYGIGSGGLFGKGLGQSMQKLGYIPEAQNDMIFSIICEELGLFGAVSIILLFAILTWRLRDIAMQAADLYGSLLVTGVMTHIAVQVILNIAVVTNAIPNTGVTLPFFSYGGTSVLFLLAEIGLVINVSRTRLVMSKPADRRRQENRSGNRRSHAKGSQSRA